MTKRKVLKVVSLLLVLLLVCSCVLLAGCGNGDGKFYTLQESYDNGWLKKKDIETIAQYYNDRFTNTENLTTEKLSLDIQNIIKETYLDDILNMPEGDINRVNIYNYYGVYSLSYVVGITDDYNAYDLLIEPEYVVAGVTFYKFSESDIRIWRGKY